MNVVLPYDSPRADRGAYLDAAQAAGVRVMLEIPRVLVRTRDTTAIDVFVQRYRDHPALFAWYLADEPSINETLGPLGPSQASRLYRVIKEADPTHPVAVAFSAGEDVRRYLGALDVVMYDDYPAKAEYTEFQRFEDWTGRLLVRGRIAVREDDFFPILQAFGGPPGAPFFGRRLPTPDEQRYMVFTALQTGATGLMFWTRYRADEKWVRDVLVPIVDELRPLLPALAAGAVLGATAEGDATAVTLYRDPSTTDFFLIAVERGGDGGRVTIDLDPGLGITRAVDGRRRMRVRDGAIAFHLGRYDARVLRLS
jgi:hypothetical protein